MEPLLAAACRHDPGRGPSDVAWSLTTGGATAYRVSGEAEGLIVLSSGQVAGTWERILWVAQVAGAVFGGPKRRLRVMRALMREVEALASLAGCTEVRIAGRMKWGAVLVGFTRTGDVLRKEV